MTALRKMFAIPLAAFYGTVGALTFLLPWTLLLCSSKSPLYAPNASYIDGFVMGVSFMFFMLLGIVFFAGGVIIYRHRASGIRPAP